MIDFLDSLKLKMEPFHMLCFSVFRLARKVQEGIVRRKYRHQAIRGISHDPVGLG